MFDKKSAGSLLAEDRTASGCRSLPNPAGIFSQKIAASDDSVAAEEMSSCPASLDQPRILLTIRETASLLRVSESTVRNAIRGGQLKAFRFGTRGGSIRISPADLEDYAASCSTSAAPRFSPKASAPSKGTPFQSLDGAKLLAAWRRQGIFGDRQQGKITLPKERISPP